MRLKGGRSTLIVLIIIINTCCCLTNSVNLKDIFSTTSTKLVRLPRENKYYQGRYGSSATSEPLPQQRGPKPEEARDPPTPSSLGRRCTRCDPRYLDSRYPNDRDRYYDDRRYKEYDDRRYDDYRDPSYDRYSRDRHYERDRYERPEYYDRGYSRDYRDYDRYDRDRLYYDRRERDRGIGYDNRGYDNRGYADDYYYRDREREGGHRPYEDPYYRGYEIAGRGHYYPGGRPEPDYYGGYGGGYAGSYSGGRDRDNYNRGYSGGGYYRPRDPYDGHRGTSYLYARPSSSTTTNSPAGSNNNSDATQATPQENTSG